MRSQGQVWALHLSICSAIVFLPAAMHPASAMAQQGTLVSCKPAEERTQPEGCWILANKPLGKLPAVVFWTLDVYPTQESAEKAGTSRSKVVQALGRIWLFTVGEKPALAPRALRITAIGPLPVHPDEPYTAQWMESILQPGSVSRTHTHAGPEAFYTEAGEACLETPEGKQVGHRGTDVVIPGGTPMELVATGGVVRRGITLILYSSGQPATTLVADWRSTGLCMSSK